MIRTLCAGAGGMAVALILVLACGADGVGSVDAQATCDCPAAEPPLASRVTVVTDEVPLAAGGIAGGAAGCPSDGVLLSGGCRLKESNAAITLNESYGRNAGDEAWICSWHNDTASDNTGITEAYCLMPAE